jgi:hypothetical protein
MVYVVSIEVGSVSIGASWKRPVGTGDDGDGEDVGSMPKKQDVIELYTSLRTWTEVHSGPSTTLLHHYH